MTWTESIARKECARDRLKAGDMVGEAIALALTLVVTLYFAASQVQDTGFFTSDFGPLAEALFYGSLLFGLVPVMFRVLTRRRNRARPYEVANSLLFVTAAAYFLSSWPFDVSHLADLLPESMRFIIDWLTNDLAQMLTAFAMVISLMVAVWTSFLYIVVRDQLRREPQ